MTSMEARVLMDLARHDQLAMHAVYASHSFINNTYEVHCKTPCQLEGAVSEFRKAGNARR